ncbi:MAG: hypothetical protein ACRDNS_12260, partial [Trebonia sp.]
SSRRGRKLKGEVEMLVPSPEWAVPETTFDEPPEYDVGDRVIAANAIGPVWHRRVARGTHGIVVARTAKRLIAVRFAEGTVEHVHPNDLRFDTTSG